MRLTRYSYSDPFDALLRLQDALQSVFDKPFGLELGVSGRGVFPPVNVFSDDGGYVVRAEIPGVELADLSVETHAGTLKLAGKRSNPVPAAASFHRRERWGGEFSRSLRLPTDADATKAAASLRHGVLTVRIPKLEAARPREISVTGGDRS